MTDVRLPVTSAQDDRWLGHVAGELRDVIEGDVRFTRHERMLFATDASIYQVEPLGVVAPRHAEDVQRLVQYCSENNLPILPRGGGTSLAGQAVNRAIVIDFSRYCNRILEIDAAQHTATVEPGVVLAHLNQALQDHGLMFGPDVATAAHANIGGMIGNNSAGAHSILYGRTVEHLLGLDVLLADGTALQLDEDAAVRDQRVATLTRRIAEVVLPLASQIEDRFPKILRHVDGYNLDLIVQKLHRSGDRGHIAPDGEHVNLAHLLCGSEGTLAVTTRAKLRLVEAPKRKGLAIVVFADVEEAIAAVKDVLTTKLAAVELLDDVVIGLARQNTECRKYVATMPCDADGSIGALLYVEYFAESESDLESMFRSLDAVVGKKSVKRFTSGPEMAMAWKLRAAGEPLLHGLPGARKPLTFVEDAAVDPAHLPEFIREFRAILDAHGTTAAYYAHASVGCLHVRPMIDLRSKQDRDAMQHIAAEVAELAMRYGGALSGEHGDGRLRSHLLERFYGRDICEGFRAIKRLFDPRNMMNPGIIVDPEPMLDHLRIQPHPKRDVLPFPSAGKTFFRYEKEHGFGGAVELCNGAGVCRKTAAGTMCPSYRATLDERHATRGRGNALRLAITGQLSPDGRTPAWDDPDTHETLDLCLSCKACKSECPSNVDVAKLKSEYLAHSYDARGGPPLSVRFFGDLRTIHRLGSAMHPVANALGRFGPARALASYMLGIDHRRTLPRFNRSLHKWMRSRATLKAGSDQETVILFPDCTTVYSETNIGKSAVEVLERLGYRVVLPEKVGCCGRAMLSLGLLRDAQRVCAATARALVDVVQRERAVAVVGCEPSCLSAILDDWQDLEMDVDREALTMLKQCTWSVEDFVASMMETAQVRMDHHSRAVLLHGHCHQKALWGTDRTEQVLRRLANDRVEVLDAGCCGMAGAFGMTRAHYDVSLQVGELALFPALRDHPEATVLAPGGSCRLQMDNVLGRKSLHPIEFIHRCLTA